MANYSADDLEDLEPNIFDYINGRKNKSKNRSSLYDDLLKTRGDRNNYDTDTDTVMLIIIVVFLALFFYYLFCDNKDSSGCSYHPLDAFNSAITNLGLIAILTVFTATVAAPGKLTKLYADNKLFRFIYFYLVIYILADQSFHGGISHLWTLVATVVALFIYDLLSEPGDGYVPFFPIRSKEEAKSLSKESKYQINKKLKNWLKSES